MPATYTPLVVEQGAEWSHGWRVKYLGVAIDATWVASGQVRAFAASPTILHTFACSVLADGSVVIAVSAAASAAWSWTEGVYDVKVANAAGTVTLRVAKGTVVVDPGVTR